MTKFTATSLPFGLQTIDVEHECVKYTFQEYAFTFQAMKEELESYGPTSEARRIAFETKKPWHIEKIEWLNRELGMTRKHLADRMLQSCDACDQEPERITIEELGISVSVRTLKDLYKAVKSTFIY